MNKRTPIIDISGNEPESLIQLGKKLGKDKVRRKVFDVIYGRGQKPRSKKQIMAAAGIPAKHAQQVQNQLNYLATNHLIVSSKNEGRINDGSIFLYERDDTVRAHRPALIRIADDKTVAEKMVTKRRPQISSVQVRRVTPRSLRGKKGVTVLYLTADADKTSPLRVEVEVARVQEEIRGSKFRNNIKVEYRPAANLKALVNGLNDFAPDIVHFSGHGNKKVIATDNRKINSAKALDLPFEMFGKALAAVDKPPRIVVLNSCESSGAKVQVSPHTDVLITMKATVSDIAATVFATQFYAAIASGQSVKSAFEQGRNAVENASISETDTPEMFVRPNLDAKKIKLT